MNGWGNVFLAVTPDGRALPCHAARELPGFEFPDVRYESLRSIWYDSPLFNAYRGTDWMREPCRSCPERDRDLGGCRCQALMLTGDARNADPVCSLSPHHDVIEHAVARAEESARTPGERMVARRAGHAPVEAPVIFRTGPPTPKCS